MWNEFLTSQTMVVPSSARTRGMSCVDKMATDPSRPSLFAVEGRHDCSEINVSVEARGFRTHQGLAVSIGFSQGSKGCYMYRESVSAEIELVRNSFHWRLVHTVLSCVCEAPNQKRETPEVEEGVPRPDR